MRLGRLLRHRLVWLLLDRWERDALIQTKQHNWGRHFADLHVRRHGKNERHEADYLETLARLVP